MQTVSDFIVQRLEQWGIRRVYGYPGDGINGMMGALQRSAGRMEFVQARHEEMAAFMACAHAKFTGQIGVCIATSGPGAIHLLNGLYDAKMDHQPVLALVGQQARSALGGDYQQEVELQGLFKDVAKDFVHTATTAAQVRPLIDRALRIALDQRTVTCVILPNDVQELEAVKTPAHKHGTVHTGIGYTAHAHVPDRQGLLNAAEVLNAGSRVAMLVGAGALHASAEIKETAELLGAGVAKALLGKAAIADDLPYVTGAIGLLGTQASWQLMNRCDTLFMIGSSFPFSEFLPEEGQARGVQIDRDGRALSMRYPMEVGLAGDSRETLRALIPLLERKTERAWQEEVEHEVDKWWKKVDARAALEASPVNPQSVFQELSTRLPDNAIVTCDSGSSTNWYARNLRMGPGMMGSVSGGLASMGCAVPYAIAAKLAMPDRPVIALAGDGAMQMNGMNELITIADRWREWSSPTLIVMVLNNGDLNEVSWEQRALGDPRFPGSQALPPFRYADYGTLLGLRSQRVATPEEIGPAWEAALRADRPVVLEMVTDPHVAPIPPHIEPAQALAYLNALRKEPATGSAALRATLKQWWVS